jgi:hypothetical protein
MLDPPLPISGKVTAILLSWRRIETLRKIVEALAVWRRIDEILVWNNNPDFQLEVPPAITINSGANFGPIARLGAVLLARNETIWFQDDDVLLSEGQFEAVFAAYAAHPDRIYGCQGRDIVDGKYDPRPVYGPCDIIVGQTMLFHRSLMHQAFYFAGRVPILSHTDDVLLSLACSTRHFAVNLEPVVEIGWDDENALWRAPDHFRNRQKIIDIITRTQKWAARQQAEDEVTCPATPHPKSD